MLSYKMSLVILVHMKKSSRKNAPLFGSIDFSAYEQNKPLVILLVYFNSISVFKFQFNQYMVDQDLEIFS